jgi:uncharacterized protein
VSSTIAFPIVAGLSLLFAAAAAVWLAERNIRVRARRRTKADDRLARQAGADVESVEVAAHDGVRLSGWLLHPEAWRGEAAMVLHGFVDSRAAMLEHARFLLSHGYAVLAPDSRGHGESGGRAVSFGLREAADVSAWGDWLCERLGIDNFVGLGQSMGAAVLINAMPLDRRLERVVAESAFTSFREAAYDRLAGRMHVPRWLAHWMFRPVGELAFLYVRWRYGFNLHATRPVDVLRRENRRVLLIHGADDEAVRAAHSRKLQAVSGADYWEVSGAGHTEPLRVAGREYERRVIEWLTTSRRAGNPE